MSIPSDTFDWHLSLRAHPQLRPFLLPSAHGLGPDARVLVVGCGDSTLSEDLWDAGCTRVAGVDIEERCIAAARARTAGKPGLEWRTCDLEAPDGLPADLGADFALALDKGTLDALVCAGDDAACRAVWNVRAALRPGGVLVVVTLHCDGKVARFVGARALGFARVEAHALSVPAAFDGKVIVCALPLAGAEGAAAASYAEYRAEVAAAAYEDATQLLTPAREGELRALFALHAHSLDNEREASAVGRRGVPLVEAYALVFTPAERCEYSLADFVEDAADFEPALAEDGARWGADDAVRFLRAMQ
jgi:SAM-dependent methyltransferase